MTQQRITVIRGDGIGPDIIDSAIQILDKVGCNFAYDYADAGLMALENHGELLPEEDITIEGGFDITLSKKFNINATYFYREETNKIGYDPTTFHTINDLGTFLARGFETEVNFKMNSKLSFLANYTHINRDENLLLKIPQNKFFIKADYKLTNSTFTSLSYRYVDETTDFGNVSLDAYNLVDFFINHSLLDGKVTFYGSITNIFNENFQEIAGFTTRGRNYSLGLNIKL